jgi:hypothetical protein
MRTRDLVVTALVILLALGFWSLANPPTYQAQVLKVDAIERKRFTPEDSVDVAMAMGVLIQDPPHMLNPPQPGPPLLLYPPSAEDLAKLSGP